VRLARLAYTYSTVNSKSWIATFDLTSNNIGPTQLRHIAVLKKARKHYCLYSDNAFYESLLKIFMQDQQELLHTFIKKENINRSTFCHFYVESGLLNLKEGGNRDEAQARLCLNAYFEKKTKNRSYRTSNATMATKYLTDNEELAIIQLCRLLGGMGYGITRDELQDIVSSITNFDLDERDAISVSDKVVRGLFSQHGDLLKIVQASSLDPKCVKQACTQTRDAMFAKLDSYICLLKAINLVPWQTYQEIPPNCLFNMDELGNDTTKKKKKVIVGKTQQEAKEICEHLSKHPRVMAACHGTSPCV